MLLNYSDLNYALLATLLEVVTGGPACGEIERRFLSVFGLRDTAPSKVLAFPASWRAMRARRTRWAGTRCWSTA
jgi:CubicO group peptidase (beta-lactamase class C family)